ncbi:histone-lysine N-methyltransferase ash1 isoform X1 [Frieseomelitta varia]|uniref:histone-lysine N-methyltransferase ash1 isoform X1 n=1 Tax=Frieseomelitta varia TaxID=561572 RepID=UPI001CB6800D|nr:histone-lysine N-methyltransferase ash1 isoform X1 [Frieseomelitta varia]XP_043516874.1 histone-lysine N-methyltransferase ash1 isoform X1 [Frieseomelitta varia]XP_043516875.1 histone-lysine N-methyltransferase ash1 isoform X1 [Frieseomelitta varia]XP_043516877.1 histone-lysine N-methyltransferase ash1 isoform X1 [Frieseomelitta varia]XP_043516878.1 histone-lysine N-methyltransferase ash1 isoform X1 [Frieseomelitta varia]XP_043516879.1 histone-lysine N-methyltransferase ash1 isoform X1 [Fri
MSGDSGWNAVIHHPSELELQNWNWEENDGEQERELPSTVDMDAIKGGGSWDPTTEPNGTDSVDSEEDSDSDDESSGGTEGSCSYSNSDSDSDDESSGDEEEDTGSNSDCTSEHSEQTFSIQKTNFEPGALKLKISMKGPKKEDLEKEKGRRSVPKKVKSNRGGKSSECSSDDSDSSESRLPSQHMQQQQQQTQQSQQQQQSQQHPPLQEINQEDLAAILPDQEHEDAPFDGFEDSESGRLVSKAIERMSLGADSDTSENGDQNPVPVYSSTLLQQFVEKTALLSEPRKRRSKLGKKLNDSEYPCVSNVSPDSGIQSVDNSPLHLAISPVSPPAPTQSPVQPVITKPAVNVDRVLYPPKRKPGRPAKTVSTQPRGPGRPRLKPEIVEKIEKIEKTEKTAKNERTEKKESAPQPTKVTKEEPPKRGKAKSAPQKAAASRADKDEENNSAKKLKEKPACQKKRSCNVAKQCIQTKITGKRNNTGSPARIKCLSRTVTNKYGKEGVQCNGGTCKKMGKDKSGPGNKTTSLRRQKQSTCERVSNDRKVINSNKKSLKENRSNTVPLAKRQASLKKNVAPVTRRVLKENKSSKKAGAGFETNGVGVQTLISLPVGEVLKAEKVENVTNKCDKATQPIHNHCHKHHHHKHRRRLLLPPKNPIRIHPCLIQELEKLIDEFSRLCSLGRNNSSSGYSELPQIFRVKKLTKKRKGGDVTANDDQKLKRRLKKEKILSGTDSKNSMNANANSNPNEQRLPLKKRHYHVSSPHSSQSSNASGTDVAVNEANSTESHIEEAIEATITRYGGSSAFSFQEDSVPVTPKKRHRDTEAGSPDKSSAASSDLLEEKPLSQIEVQPRRKKKIVKDLRVTVTKLPVESHGALEKAEKTDKAEKADSKAEKSEKSSSDSRNLKSRAEKSSRGEKVATEKLIKNDKSQADKIEKRDISPDHVRLEKNIKIDAAEFNAVESFDDNEAANETKPSQNSLNPNVPNPLNSAAVLVLTKKKMRRRKAINRTGFPTLKKKKKRSLNANETSTDTSRTVASTNEDGTEADGESSTKEGIEDSVVDSKTSVLNNTEIQDAFTEESSTKQSNNNLVQNRVQSKADPTPNPDPNSPKSETNGHVRSDETVEPRSGQLRVRKDLVEIDNDNALSKLCPVKFEKIQDSRSYDENASLEESLERFTANQRVAELSEENVKRLERSNSQTNIKTEHSSSFNGNQKKRRGSSSPCNLIPRNMKRLRSSGYDTENDILPSNDILNDDHEVGKHSSSTHTRKKQSRWKKRYLQGGILQEYGKDFEGKTRSSIESSNAIGRNKVICETNESPSAALLSATYQCGKLLRQRKMPFQLPYDLWWLHTQSRLPGRESVPSWNYKKIRTNVYYDVKPTTLYEAQACECKPESGCGDDCINRMVFSECSPQLCPCGDKCENQKIQKHEWAPGLQKFMTEDKGWGVRTQQAIKSGVFILEYVGEVVSEREFKSRMATRYANDTHHYCLHLDGGLVIDGHRMGGDGRFVNHSCEPNCEMQKWSVHGLPRMALFASRDIKPGEELTYDYNFALFNPSEGQECRCGSSACRGVIGGKSQRVSKSITSIPSQLEPTERRSVGRPRKNVRKSNTVQSVNSKGICKSRKVGDSSLIHAPVLKPMSHQQRCFAQQHHCFLLRNLEKVRRVKLLINQVQMQNGKVKCGNAINIKEKSSGDAKIQSDAFFSQLTALTNTNTRTVRTRRLAQAQDDPEVHKTAKLAKVLKDLYSIVATAKDENGQLLCTPFITLPSKRKLPDYYEKISDPIDLTTIDQCIGTGHYKTAEHFDHDMIKLFDNNVRFFGRTSEMGIAAARLRKLYLGSKPDFVDAITEAVGCPPSQGFLPPRGSTAGEEDVIRCICGLHRDEGLMIQCERCLVWQHCDCVKADTTIESYLCERCHPRPVDLEIPLEGDEEEEGKKHYVTLMRGDLQLRQGDTVYVLRDTLEKHTYKTIQKPDYEQMDIFRIERLWKNAEGERFVFGHHYLRPHETYHEPTRKFYENEVVCAPLYEAVPCDLVAERCWVLDPHTYCKGRPVGSTPEHTYVCEYRVDRAARLFTKVARARHQVCTKPYAFETFPQRIKHYRTYLPHSLEGIQIGGKMNKEKKKGNNQDVDNNHKSESSENTKTHIKDQQKSSMSKSRRKSNEILSIVTPTTSYAQREEQRRRLNNILIALLQKMPNKKDPLDLSFLLERNRRNRKRPGGLNP